MGIHDGHRERMRQRYLDGGLDCLAEHEVLELLLYFSIARRNTNDIAHDLIGRYGSLAGVLNAPFDDLLQVENIGKQSAMLIKLVNDIQHKSRLLKIKNSRPVMDTPEKWGTYLVEYFRGETREIVYQAYMDRNFKLISCERLMEGDIDCVRLDRRKLTQTALNLCATKIVLAHNHPSGIATPSNEDIAATLRLGKELLPLGLSLVDHIIVADGDYTSMSKCGHLDAINMR